MTDDFFEQVAGDANTATGDISIVVDAVQLHAELTETIAVLEKGLKDKKEMLRQLEEEKIPEAMQQCNINKFEDDSGLKVSIQKIVKASLPTKSAIDKAKDDHKDELLHKHAEGIAWLKSNNASELIKNKVEAEFGKGQDNMAGDFFAQLQENGIPAKKHSTVAPQTLSKFVGEKIAEGVDVPRDVLSVHTGQKAKISRPKK